MGRLYAAQPRFHCSACCGRPRAPPEVASGLSVAVEQIDVRGRRGRRVRHRRRDGRFGRRLGVRCRWCRRGCFPLGWLDAVTAALADPAASDRNSGSGVSSPVAAAGVATGAAVVPAAGAGSTAPVSFIASAAGADGQAQREQGRPVPATASSPQSVARARAGISTVAASAASTVTTSSTAGSLVPSAAVVVASMISCTCPATRPWIDPPRPIGLFGVVASPSDASGASVA